MKDKYSDEEIKLLIAFMTGFLAGQQVSEDECSFSDIERVFSGWLNGAKEAKQLDPESQEILYANLDSLYD